MAAFDFPSSPNVNDIYTLNGVAFMWNGSVWKRYSTSTGAQGFQGAAGAAGAQGAQGTAGVLGSDGAQGAVGAQGAAGNAGSTGAQGAAGAAGAQGAAGATGAQGAPFDRSEYNYTASGGQTAFAAAYANASDVDVFMNGVRLTPAEYTPSGGTTITLASGATAGDIIDILTFASAGPTGAQGAQGHQGDAFNRSESNFTATSGQTSFAPSGGYTNGDDLDVFVNGVRLTPADYTATNGTNVVLDVGANTGDIVDIIYYEAAGPAGAQGAAGAAGIAGTITFSTSAPSNPIMGDLWYDTDDGAFAGYYNDGNTSQWIDLSGGPRGAQGADGAQGATGSVPSNITAVSGTFSGNVSIGGTLTYEDVTNIDSVGVITARNGIIINNASSTFDPHLTLFAENNSGGILIAKHASSYPDLEFRAEAGGGSLDLFKGIASEQAGNSSYYTGLKLNDNKALLMGTGGDSLVRYDPTPGVLEIKTLVSEPIALSTNDTERFSITSSGVVKVGGNTLVSPHGNADNFVIDTGDVDSGLSILSATTGRIYFGDAADSDVGSIRYVHTDNSMRFETAASERLRLFSDGSVRIGDNSIAVAAVGGGPTLAINGAAPEITLRDSATNNPYAVMRTNDYGSLTLEADAGNNAANSTIHFRVDGAERMRINSSFLLYGDTASDLSGTHATMFCGSNHAFQREGDAGTYLTIGLGAANGTVDLEADARSGNYPDMRFITTNDEHLRITASGNIWHPTGGNLFLGTTNLSDFTSAGRTGNNNISIRAGSPNAGTSPANSSTAIKIYPAGYRSATTGNLTGGIAWQHLDPSYGSWDSSYGAGAQIWMGASLHDTPGQERDRFNLWMNSSTTGNSNPNNLAIEAYPNGMVRHPKVPAFYAYRNNDSGQKSAGDQVYHATRVNNGSCYSTSNGRFTAPIDGIYLFAASIQLYGGPSSGTAMSFRINGTDFHGSYNSSNPVYDEPAGNHGMLYFTAVINLSQNDYVTVNTSQTVRGMQSYFTGHLVG
jgi:hypothetical protein